MAFPYVIPGFDPTADPAACVTREQLLAMVRELRPESAVGFVVIGDTAPDVGANADLARFLWLNTDDNGLHYYDGASWSLVTSAAILNNDTVIIQHLSPDGGTPVQVLAVNADVSAFEFAYVINLIAPRSLPLSRLVVSTPGHFMAVRASATGNAWESAPINDLLTPSAIGVDKLSLTTATVLIETGDLTIDAANNRTFYVELTENVTSFDILNLPDGATMQVKFQQDIVGGRAIAFGTVIEWPAGAAPTAPSGAEEAMIVSITNFSGTLNAVYVMPYNA